MFLDFRLEKYLFHLKKWNGQSQNSTVKWLNLFNFQKENYLIDTANMSMKNFVSLFRKFCLRLAG